MQVLHIRQVNAVLVEEGRIDKICVMVEIVGPLRLFRPLGIPSGIKPEQGVDRAGQVSRKLLPIG